MSAPDSWRATRRAHAMSPWSRRLQMVLTTLVAVGLVAALIWWYWWWLTRHSRTHVFVLQIEYPLARPEIPLVPFAANDAEALSHLGGAVRLTNLRNLQGAESEDTLESELRGSGIRKNDVLILYIKAHGIAGSDGTAYLLNSDFDPAKAGGRTKLSDLLASVRAVPGKTKLVVLDVCHFVEDVGSGLPVNQFPLLLGREMAALPPNVWVINSCAALERSEVSYALKQSVFAHFVAEGLRGEADGFVAERSRGNRDGEINLAELYEYVRLGVGRWVLWSHARAQHPLLFRGGKSMPVQPDEAVVLAQAAGDRADRESAASESQVAKGNADSRSGKEPAAASEASRSQQGTGGQAQSDNEPVTQSPQPTDAKDESGPQSVLKLLITAWRWRDQAEARAEHRPSPIDVAPAQWREAVDLLYRYEQLYRDGYEAEIPVGDLTASVGVLKAIATGTSVTGGVAQGLTLTAKLREVKQALEASSPFTPSNPPQSLAMARLFGGYPELLRLSDELHAWSRADSPEPLPASAAPAPPDKPAGGPDTAAEKSKKPQPDFGTWAKEASEQHPAIVELAFAQTIARLVERGDDWNLLRLALQTRLLAEEAATYATWCTPWVKDDVTRGDERFYRGQRELVLGFADGPQRARSEFAAATDDYNTALTRAGAVAEQRNHANDWRFRSIDFVKWSAWAGESATGKRPPDEQFKTLYAGLAETIDRLNAGREPTGIEGIRKRIGAIEEAIAPSAVNVILSDREKPGIVGEMESLLSTALLRAEQREALLKQLPQLEPPERAFGAAIGEYTLPQQLSEDQRSRIQARADAYRDFAGLKPVIETGDERRELFAWQADRCLIPLAKRLCLNQANLPLLGEQFGHYAALAGRSPAGANWERYFDVQVDSSSEGFLSLSERESRDLALTIKPRENFSEPAKAWIVLGYDKQLVELGSDSPVARGTDLEQVLSQEPGLMLSPGKPQTIALSLRAQPDASQAETSLVACVVFDGPQLVYEARRIRLGLPVVDLVAEGAVPGTVENAAAGEIRLHPFPNHSTAFRLGLLNRSHAAKTVKVQVLALPEPPGDARGWTKDSLPHFENGERWPAGGPQPTTLLEPTDFAVPADGKASWINLTPKPPEAPAGAAPPAPPGQPAAVQKPAKVSIRRGLVCIIQPPEGKPRWKWVQIVPLHPDQYVDPEVRYDLDQRRVVVEVRPKGSPPRLPDGATKIDWEIRQNEALFGAKRKDSGSISRESPQTELWLEPGNLAEVFVRLTVDGYPRAFVYRVDCTRSGRGLDETDVPRIRIDAPRNGDAFKASEPSIQGVFEIDAPRDQLLRGGHIEVGFDLDGDNQFEATERRTLLYFDRQVDANLGDVGEGGFFKIDCTVRDLQLDLANPNVRNVPVRLLVQLFLDNRPRPTLQEHVDVVFDDAPPKIEQVQAVPEEVEEGQSSEVFVRASDASGIKAVQLALDLNRNGQFDEEPVPAERLADGRWMALLKPPSRGSFRVLVKVTDGVGLSESMMGSTLHVSPASAGGKSETAFVVTVLYRDKPVENAEVVLWSVPKQGDAERMQNGKTDARGQFEFRPRPPGTYKIQAEGIAGDRRRSGEQDRTISKGDKPRISVRIPLE